MNSRWKSTRATLTLAVLSVLLVACESNGRSTVTAPLASTSLAATRSQANTNGAAGQMPAYYDGDLVTVNMKEMPDDASASLPDRETVTRL